MPIKTPPNDLKNYLQAILTDLKTLYSDYFMEDVPYELGQLKIMFKNWLNRLNGGVMDVVFILDGIDQLDNKAFDWLPDALPNNIQIIVSVATNDALRVQTLIRRIGENQCKTVRISPLSLAE